jgi:predicted house-cleaning noncanonical NTP pyrophosphatase (MazG superfamily)
MRVEYHKLVRDRVPELIRERGGRPATRVLDAPSYHVALLAKLVEEAAEARQAADADLPGELADVLEVLRALAASAGLTWDQLQAAADTKRNHRGGFTGRLFLEYVDQAGGGDAAGLPG